MSPGERTLRLGKLLKEEISAIFRDEIFDPSIKAVKVLTITDVKLSPDLKIAKVYISLYGEPGRVQEAFLKISKATSFVRFKVSERMKDLKFIPEIRFFQDTTAEKVSKVMEIFQKIEKERKERAESDKGISKNKKSSRKK